MTRPRYQRFAVVHVEDCTAGQAQRQLQMTKTNAVQAKPKYEKIVGGAGHRSPYLSHAKRALYHLSYTPRK